MQFGQDGRNELPEKSVVASTVCGSFGVPSFQHATCFVRLFPKQQEFRVHGHVSEIVSFVKQGFGHILVFNGADDDASSKDETLARNLSNEDVDGLVFRKQSEAGEIVLHTVGKQGIVEVRSEFGAETLSQKVVNTVFQLHVGSKAVGRGFHDVETVDGYVGVKEGKVFVFPEKTSDAGTFRVHEHLANVGDAFLVLFFPVPMPSTVVLEKGVEKVGKVSTGMLRIHGNGRSLYPATLHEKRRIVACKGFAFHDLELFVAREMFPFSAAAVLDRARTDIGIGKIVKNVIRDIPGCIIFEITRMTVIKDLNIFDQHVFRIGMFVSNLESMLILQNLQQMRRLSQSPQLFVYLVNPSFGGIFFGRDKFF